MTTAAPPELAAATTDDASSAEGGSPKGGRPGARRRPRPRRGIGLSGDVVDLGRLPLILRHHTVRSFAIQEQPVPAED